MKAFHHVVRLGVVSSSSGAFQSQELHECVPEIGLKMTSAICENCEGTPKREIHPLMKVWATASAVIEERGIASGHCVNRSTHVRR